MKSLKEIYNNLVLNEALSVSQYRSIFKNISDEYKNRYKSWFDGKWRIYLDTNEDVKNDKTVKIPDEIEKEIKSKGYEIDDYIKGIAVDRSKKRIIKIGKLLKDNPDLIKLFNERLKGNQTKSNSDYLVVISRHPYDIAGMSMDRGWSSCKKLTNGSNKHYIPSEIDGGYLIAYVIKNDDLNIKNPVGRLLLVPYVNVDDKNDTFLVVSPRVYGSDVSGFKSTVEKWLDKHQRGDRTGKYNFVCGYNDNFPREIIKLGSDSPIETLLKTLEIKNYKINDDGSVDVEGDVNLNDLNLQKIPIKFGVVKGYFNCSNNKLINLINSPESVSHDFICSSNSLTTLEGGPKNVDGSFMCSYNSLTTLEGGPKNVGRHFYCSYNDLITLEGSPENISRNFYCNNNRLTTLKGSPEKVGLSFYCDNNKLITLKGGPKNVSVNFYCDNNPVKFTKEDVEKNTNVSGEIITTRKNTRRNS